MATFKKVLSGGLGANGAAKYGPGNWPPIVNRRGTARLKSPQHSLTFDRADLERELGRLFGKEYGSNAPAALDALWEIIQYEKEHDDMLEAASEIMGGFRVESVRDPTDGSGAGRIARYVNMGDAYDITLLYAVEEGAWRITSWGTYIEEWEEANTFYCSICMDGGMGTYRKEPDDVSGEAESGHMHDVHGDEIYLAVAHTPDADKGVRYWAGHRGAVWTGDPEQASYWTEQDDLDDPNTGDKIPEKAFFATAEEMKEFEANLDNESDVKALLLDLAVGKKVVRGSGGVKQVVAPSAAAAASARCIGCGAKLRPTDVHCYGCGRKV